MNIDLVEEAIESCEFTDEHRSWLIESVRDLTAVASGLKVDVGVLKEKWELVPEEIKNAIETEE